MRLTTALCCIALALVIIGLVLVLGGCAIQRPRTAQPMAFRHCAVTRELPGFVGCDCPNPLVTFDAQTKRKIVYCDGQGAAMKVAIIGSGVRRSELDIRDCELKDLAVCIQTICAQSFSGSATYGCTELTVLGNTDTVSPSKKHNEFPKEEA